MDNDNEKKVYTALVFSISLLVFIFSIVSGGISISGINLAGSAGMGNSPENNDPISLDLFDNSVSIISGIISIFAAVYGIQLTRSEFAKLRAVQIDKEMQRAEIEKLRIELELEKFKAQKKKSKPSPQRQEGKAKTKPKQDNASKLKSKKVRS